MPRGKNTPHAGTACDVGAAKGSRTKPAHLSSNGETTIDSEQLIR